MLDRFATSKEGGAIVLQGKWGTGKTFFWRKKVVEPYLKKPWRKKYSYVSLFGLNSLEGLKTSIYQATEEFDCDLRNRRWRFFHPRWLWWKASVWLPDVIASSEIPYVGGGLSQSLARLNFLLVRNRLICFDDIERRGVGLELRDVLGLVSYLVEERNCRIVVILNNDALGADAAIWEENKEKVFIGEISFAPSATDLIRLGLEGSEREVWYEVVRKSLGALGVTNIRVVQRVRRFMTDLFSSIEKRVLRSETINTIGRVVPLLTFAHAGRSEGAPPLDFVMSTNIYAHLLRPDDQEVSAQEKTWTKLLSDYGVFLGDDLDQALFEMIKRGYPDGEKLLVAIGTFEEEAVREADKARYKRAWALYHDTVEDNAEEFVEAILDAWPHVSLYENVHNLQSIAVLLRRFGRADAASSFIRDWVEQRSGDRVRELSRDEIAMFRMPTDPELLEVIDAAVQRHETEVMPLSDALRLMGDDRVIKESAVAAIAQAEPHDLAHALVANPGESLIATMRNTLGLGDRPERPTWAKAKLNMVAAAKLLAARSEINRDRMRNWFQIDAD